MTRQGHTLRGGGGGGDRRGPACSPRPARGLIDYIPAKAAVSFSLREAPVFVPHHTQFLGRKGALVGRVVVGYRVLFSKLIFVNRDECINE